MYKISFWFEHGGECLWAKNDLTRNKYGYPINPEKLPLSQKSIRKFKEILYLIFDYPHKYYTFKHFEV